LAIAIAVLSLVPRDVRPETALPHHWEHFTICWVIGFTFGLAYNRKYRLLATLLLIFTALIEIAQLDESEPKLDQHLIGAWSVAPASRLCRSLTFGVSTLRDPLHAVPLLPQGARHTGSSSGSTVRNTSFSAIYLNRRLCQQRT
jgi:hypothetical protein